MHVAIAGGHGKIALRLTALLAGRTDRVTSIIRNPAHRADVEQAGGTAVVLDLEATTVDDLAAVLRDDRRGRLRRGGRARQRRRPQGHRRPRCRRPVRRRRPRRGRAPLPPDLLDRRRRPAPARHRRGVAAYLTAKKAAEEAIRDTALEWTILRPGQLTDEPGTGRVLLAPPPVERADVTRDDTAAVLLALLDTPRTAAGSSSYGQATPPSPTPSAATAEVAHHGRVGRSRGRGQRAGGRDPRPPRRPCRGGHDLPVRGGAEGGAGTRICRGRRLAVV